jgi:hypothetical protein
MLYPLSYEGLACTLTQHAGRVSGRRPRAGCLAPDGLCRTCAACREPPTTVPARGADCTAGGVEPRARRLRSDEVMTWLLLAVVMLVESIGMRTGSLLANDRKPTARCPTFRSLVDGPAVVGWPICCDLLICSRCVLIVSGRDLTSDGLGTA